MIPHSRIYIVGFMGSGKTTYGKALAHQRGYDFYDLDEAIEQALTLPVREIFTLHGEAYFRKQEAAILRNTQTFENTVIATGGGTPAYHGNMEWMNDHGHTIFLDAPAETLYERLVSETASRPLLQGLQGDALRTHIRILLSERLPWYRMAHETIPG